MSSREHICHWEPSGRCERETGTPSSGIYNRACQADASRNAEPSEHHIRPASLLAGPLLKSRKPPHDPAIPPVLDCIASVLQTVLPVRLLFPRCFDIDLHYRGHTLWIRPEVRVPGAEASITRLAPARDTPLLLEERRAVVARPKCFSSLSSCTTAEIYSHDQLSHIAKTLRSHSHHEAVFDSLLPRKTGYHLPRRSHSQVFRRTASFPTTILRHICSAPHLECSE